VPTHVLSQPARLRSIPALIVLLVGLFGSLLVTTEGAADAATTGAAAVQEASRHNGAPYAYGATGPSRFDCSGFTLYVYGRLGRSLPHNAAAQYNSIRHIASSSKQVGDLIFIRSSSGSLGHVGIYAGNGRMWDAPRSGESVRLRGIYSSNYVVGRP